MLEIGVNDPSVRFRFVRLVGDEHGGFLGARK
jgi:hypothetical protein